MVSQNDLPYCNMTCLIATRLHLSFWYFNSLQCSNDNGLRIFSQVWMGNFRTAHSFSQPCQAKVLI